MCLNSKRIVKFLKSVRILIEEKKGMDIIFTINPYGDRM